MKRTRIDRFKLKQAMKGRYDTLEDLALGAHISPTTVSTGTDSYAWRGATLDAIANALGVSPVSLLTVDEVDEPANHEPAAVVAPPSSATTARQKQREALSTAELSPAEAERRAALLAQAASAQARRG